MKASEATFENKFDEEFLANKSMVTLGYDSVSDMTPAPVWQGNTECFRVKLPSAPNLLTTRPPLLC